MSYLGEPDQYILDKNVPSTAAVQLSNGETYIFYYVPGAKINYLKGKDGSDYGIYSVTIGEVETDVVGSASPLACTTWEDKIRLYYIADNGTVKELCLNDGKWTYGALTNENYATSQSSGLYALGTLELRPPNPNVKQIKVFFSEANTPDKITEAYIEQGVWKKKVFSRT